MIGFIPPPSEPDRPVLPHPALQFGVSPPRGLTTLRSGGNKESSPLRSKEALGQRTCRYQSMAFALPPFGRRIVIQAHSYPLIQRWNAVL